MNINPLIGILNPREIPQFIESIQKVTNIDKLHIKYFKPEHDAYYTLRLWFLMHPEYTHLIICPDDIVFEPHHINTLIDDIEKYNFPVITGYANLDLAHPNIYSISLHPIHIDRKKRNPILLTKETIPKERLIKVKWCGFGLTVIRRDVVEMIPFEDDARYNRLPYGSACCVDTSFSWECLQKNIPIYCNTIIKILHLRKNSSPLVTNFYAGIRPRRIEFIPHKLDSEQHCI